MSKFMSGSAAAFIYSMFKCIFFSKSQVFWGNKLVLNIYIVWHEEILSDSVALSTSIQFKRYNTTAYQSSRKLC